MSRPAGASPWRIAALLGFATWLVYATTAGGSLGTGDAVAVFESATALIDRGTMDVPPSQSAEAWRGLDGRYYTPFGVGQPIYDVPFVLAGRAVRRFAPGRLGQGDVIPKAIVAMANTIPAAVAVVFGTLIAWRLSSNVSASVATGVFLAFGTLLWPYGKSGFSAALTAGTLAAGVFGIAAGGLDRRPVVVAAGGLSLGLAMLTRHEMAIAALVCVVWLGWQTRGSLRLIASGAAGVAIAASIAMAVNLSRFGHPLMTGHRPEFSGAGFLGFLASPSGALWLYSPLAIAMIALVPDLRRRKPLPLLLAGVVVAMTLFYGALDDWLGTRSYGPRYLVPLLPLMVAPLALWLAKPRRMPRALMALCALSVAIQIPAIATDASKAGIAANQPPQSIRRDRWEWTPLWLNVRHLSRIVPANLEYVTGRVPIPATTNDTGAPESSLADRLAFSLDFWWLYLCYLGVIPSRVLPVIVLVPLTTAVLLLNAARKGARHADQVAVR